MAQGMLLSLSLSLYLSEIKGREIVYACVCSLTEANNNNNDS